MFRDMRRGKQRLTKAECEEILNTCTSGVLALSEDGGYPYAVPLSFVYKNDKLYFHCAKAGHKLELIEKYDKASFCVIANDDIVPEKFTTFYKSVIVFGKIRVLTELDEMREPIMFLCDKYAGGDEAGAVSEFEKAGKNMYMLELDIEHMSGKQCIEYIK